MKNRLTVLLFALFVTLLACMLSACNFFSLNASMPETEAVPEDPASCFEYSITNGEVAITKYIGSRTEVVIPSEIEGYPVTSISSSAFRGCDYLRSITIPASVKSIGNYAFDDCDSLASVTFGENSKLTSIGEVAFLNCSSLTSIEIPASVTSIGSSAFHYCYKLVEVYNLSSLSVTKGSTDHGYVGYYALNVYTSLDTSSKQWTTDDGFIFYEDGDVCYLLGYTGDKTDLVLPADCNGKAYAIYQYAFCNCSGLTSITIPDGVTSIGSDAFEDCTSLASITIPASVKSIGSDAFRDCTSLSDIKIPASVKSIGSDAFYGCSALSGITLPFVGATKDGTTNTHFGYIFGAFSYRDNGSYIPNSLKTVVITDGTSIGECAFYDCDSLASITIPASVKSIGSDAFSGCDSLASVTFGENSKLTSIGECAFYACNSLTSITIPANVTSICDYAFEDCTSLASVTFGENSKLESIGFVAFYNCS